MTTANATPKPRAGEHVNDAEAWMHAACLTIAETGQKWGENVHPSPAMQVVYELRKERDLLREREKALVAALEWFVTGKGTPDLDGSIARALLAKHGR